MPIRTDVTTLTKKGQVTIPKRIREYLGIKPRDRVKFEIEKGAVKIKPARTLDLNFGKVKPKRRSEDFKEMRKLFEKTVGEQVSKEA